MDDMERYGDYTEYEEDQPKKKGALSTVLKILVVVVSIIVLGVLLFRVILSGYYPKSIKQIYYNEILTEYYHKTEGNIGAKSLEVKAPYDDAKDGIFFAENLIIIDGADQIQFTVRLNNHVFKELSEKYETDITADMISFSLYRSTSVTTETGTKEEVETLHDVDVQVVNTDSFFMYFCYKVVCDNVQWDFSEESPDNEWLVLKIEIKGFEKDIYRITLYRNAEDQGRMKDYDLSRKEHP